MKFVVCFLGLVQLNAFKFSQRNSRVNSVNNHLFDGDISTLPKVVPYDGIEIMTNDIPSIFDELNEDLPFSLCGGTSSKRNDVIDKDLAEAYDYIRQDMVDNDGSNKISMIKKFASSVLSFSFIFFGIFSYAYLLFPGSFTLQSSAAITPTYLESIMYTEPEFSESGGVTFHDEEYPLPKSTVTVTAGLPTNMMEKVENFKNWVIEDI